MAAASVVYPEYRVAYLGHSLVTCDTLRPRSIPMEGVHMDLIRHGGARADKFFDYPEFTNALDSNYYQLAIVMIGGNDIEENTSVDELFGNLMSIYNAFTDKGITCVMCTIEPRVYPNNHPHYVDAETYKKISRAINRRLQRALKGHVILLGGNTFPMEVRIMDGIHPTFEGRERIWNKVSKAISQHHNIWKESQEPVQMFQF